LNLRWITGIVGLAGIAAVMTYPVRRQIYGSAQDRFGIDAYSLISGSDRRNHDSALHGGTESGGVLTTALMITYDIVIATGLFGVFCIWRCRADED
jgi:hypothetical protein